MNVQSMKEELKADLHLLVDDTRIYRKILESARFMRDKRYWFSERTFAFTLTAGKQFYTPGAGPPADLVEIVGIELQLLVGGSEDMRLSLWRTTSREFEARRHAGTQQDQPRVWDFWGNQLRFYPIPESSTDVVTGRYVRDIGVPQARYNTAASGFKFYAPTDATRELTTTELDAFTNDWFDPRGAYHMVKARAAYLLCQDLHDPDQANTYLSEWLELVGQLDAENEKRGGATEIQGVLLDADDDVMDVWRSWPYAQ